MASAPPIPPTTEIDLLPFSEVIDDARIDNEQGLGTSLVATANDDQPDVALKGSLMVWDWDHLAWWERSRRETYGALAKNPRVAVLVRNAARDRRTLRFYGEARIVDDPELTRRIWDRALQIEKDTDKERQGAAVLVRIDRVRAGAVDLQRRSR